MTNIVGCERERFHWKDHLKVVAEGGECKVKDGRWLSEKSEAEVKGLKLKLLAWGREVSSDWSYYQMIYVQKPIIIYFQAKTMSHLVQSLLQQQHWCVLWFLTNSLLWLRFAVFRWRQFLLNFQELQFNGICLSWLGPIALPWILQGYIFGLSEILKAPFALESSFLLMGPCLEFFGLSLCNLVSFLVWYFTLLVFLFWFGSLVASYGGSLSKLLVL